MISNKELLDKYPFMCAADWGFNPLRDTYDVTAFDTIPPGWTECFGLLLCEDLNKVLSEEDKKKFYFHQTKEKWGRLCMYGAYSNKDIDDILGDYEALSEQVCVGCGKVGVPTTKHGWVQPICKDCWEKYNTSSNYTYEESMCEYNGFNPEYSYQIWTDDGYKQITRSVQYIYDRIDKKFKK